MYEITEESIRHEERRERKLYLLFTAYLFLVGVIIADASTWTSSTKMVFSIVAVAYYVGYCKAYPMFYEWMMREHPMRYSSNYRMTDGHALALIASFFWPLLWLGRAIVCKIKKRRVVA